MCKVGVDIHGLLMELLCDAIRVHVLTATATGRMALGKKLCGRYRMLRDRAKGKWFIRGDFLRDVGVTRWMRIKRDTRRLAPKSLRRDGYYEKLCVRWVPSSSLAKYSEKPQHVKFAWTFF